MKTCKQCGSGIGVGQSWCPACTEPTDYTGEGGTAAVYLTHLNAALEHIDVAHDEAIPLDAVLSARRSLLAATAHLEVVIARDGVHPRRIG